MVLSVFLTIFAVNPIPRRLDSGSFINPRIASKTTLNWRSYLLSSAISLRAKSLCVETVSRNRTCPHDLYVYLNSAFTIENRGEHGDTLLRENVGRILPVLSAPGL
jgi:hypothetical protein